MPRGAGRDGGGEGWCRGGGENNTARILTLLLAPPRDQSGLRAHFLSRSHHGEGKQRRQQQQQQQQQIRVASLWVVGAVPGTDDAGVLPTPIRSFPPLELAAAIAFGGGGRELCDQEECFHRMHGDGSRT